MNFSFQGYIAPVFTPFHENMTINFDIISEYAEYLKDAGIKGVLVNGTTGEGQALSVDERKVITEKWREVTNKTKQHFMVQIGGAPLPDVLELARHAEKIGVDSILTLPDLYFKPKNPKDLIEYLKIIGNAAPKIPLFYYHIPSFSNVQTHMGEFMNEIKDKVPNFCGIKFTSTCLDEGYSAIHANNKKYAVFLGADHVLAGAFTLGFNSAIATTLNIYPDICVKIHNAIEKSDVKTARKQQEKLNKAIEIITKNGSWVSTMKHAMNLLTPIKVGKVREPNMNLNEKEVKEMYKKLKS